MADIEGGSAKPERTDEQKEAQQQVKQQAKLLAQEKGLDWKSMSPEERKEMKRSARQQMRAQRA